MHQVYRQFSRQKYNKYKHQYPKMRESEIVYKIIREWDSLGPDGKEKLHNHYENNKFISKDERPEVDPLSRSVEKVKIEKTSLDNSDEKATAVKSEMKEEGENVNEFDAYATSEQGESKRSVDSANLTTPQSKSKKITIGRNNYVSFFKHYFQKLRKEHDKWSSKQISKVISLLWVKRKIQYKTKRVKKEKTVKAERPVNARRLFRKTKKLNAEEVKTQWNHLPKQSRMLWSYPGKEIPTPLSQLQGKMVLKSTPAEETGALSFLSKFMN